MNARASNAEIIVERLARVRAVMAEEKLAALLVPSSDPHISEYVPAKWKAREWLSGFTGSMGTLVVTTTQAKLFADSRYWDAAEKELAGTTIALEKIATAASAAHLDWIAASVSAGQTVGVDGATLGLAAARALRESVEKKGATLNATIDVFARAWPDRPSIPTAQIREFLPPHATISRAEKLAALRAKMRDSSAQHHLISTLDDIAYVLNLRGADVSFNPVFVAHLLVNEADAQLFVVPEKLDATLARTLAADGVQVRPYEAARDAISGLPAKSTLLIDPRRVTFGMVDAVPSQVKTVEAVNPTTFAKSRKTSAEAQFIREAMAQDGAAMARFYAWFEQALGRERITELTIDEKLSAERAKLPNFVSLSFSTIAGFNANGALPHYRATESAHAVIEGNGLLLIDSGGQYLGGTTDITRVWPIGAISSEHKRDYTLVLKGMMALSRARFPRGTKSPMLDAIARAPIWNECIDYGHGTGHGVGYFMNVHEGPQSISAAMPESHTAMEPGMVTSIEPGIYRPGKWGVRIENLVLNVPSAQSSAFGEFLEFETLTLCPIDTRCVDVSLMRADEIAWLNAYNARVRERVSPLVDGDAKAWLIKRTEAT
jgi:Xaa-Pro aminopeptidase